jgi:hypothetical protein
MRFLNFIRRLALLAPLAVVAVGCGDSEGNCATGCPATGQPAVDGDLRLMLDSENSSVVIKDESTFVDGKIMKGEMVLRPEVAGCVGTPARPCSATLRQLSVTITDLRVGDFHFQEPTLSVDAPLVLVDGGLGYVLAQSMGIHTCVTLNGGRQHAVGQPSANALILFDDGTSVVSAGHGAYARLQAWWPLVLAFPVNECMARTLPLVVSASFLQE